MDSRSSLLAEKCPQPELLTGFSLGKISSPSWEVVANHLENCPDCESQLDELNQQPQDDYVLAQLERCFSPQPLLDEPGYSQLEAAALALGGSSTDQTNPTLPFADTPLPEEPLAGRYVGNYLILNEIHRSMGVVYRALQEKVQRPVALKMILGGDFASPKAIQRFRTEGQANARLDHPHVVLVHEFGEHEGLPFYSMELMEGGSLADRLKNGALPLREAAELLTVLAETVEFAHQHHVLHRDLKPGNILLDAKGVAKIADFGIAKLLDQADSQTRSEELVGTPAYMAPEQAEGGDLGPAVDIYALGVILFETLTGKQPFQGTTSLQILELVRTAEPVAPSRLRRGIPPDLNAICLKCLEKDPAHRYASAQDLADDLHSWLKGEPTKARPPGWPRKIWRAIRRHKIVAALAFALLAGFTAMFAMDPERPLRDIQADLAQHKPVTLIGPTGLPRWHRWLEGADKSRFSVGPDKAMHLQTADSCLLELLPDPLHDRFRLTAKIRHEKAIYGSSVGVYFAHKKYPGNPVDNQLMFMLQFNGVSFVPLHKGFVPFGADEEKLKKVLKNIPLGRPVRFFYHLYSEGHDGYNYSLAMTAKNNIFDPSGDDGPHPWHGLDFTVTPEKITVSFDRRLFNEFTAPETLEKINKSMADLRAHHPNDPTLAAIPLAMDPRGGIGLYLHKGSASFSNVTVSPLEGTE